MLEIYEESIREIVIDEPGSAKIMYTKRDPKDEYYKITYIYYQDAMEDGQAYCMYCGNVYPIDTDGPCPECNDEAQNIGMGEIKDIIILGLVNDYEVTITCFDGKVETLKM